ncbi:hypothetical protein CIB48_g9131 [Xylaria polymorpha]|nr:hypothetical protein CIB48_g9131 [Xylaria polymorpha]
MRPILLSGHVPRDRLSGSPADERCADSTPTATSSSPSPRTSRSVPGLPTMANASAPTRATRVPSGPSTSTPPPPMIASGSADNTMRLWEIKTGRLLKTWDFPTAVKRVEFSPDGCQLLGVTEKRMGHLGTIVVVPIILDVDAEQSDERDLTIVCDESKATVAGWSYLSKYIIAGHEDGSVSQYDAKTGELNDNIPIHELNMQDKSAKLMAARDLELLKTYVSDTPLNSACITPKNGGKFEARFYHRIFEDEIGRVRGHFGPLVSDCSSLDLIALMAATTLSTPQQEANLHQNTVAADPTGKSYASGGEDGYVRVHHFDKGYFDFILLGVVIFGASHLTEAQAFEDTGLFRDKKKRRFGRTHGLDRYHDAGGGHRELMRHYTTTDAACHPELPGLMISYHQASKLS